MPGLVGIVGEARGHPRVDRFGGQGIDDPLVSYCALGAHFVQRLAACPVGDDGVDCVDGVERACIHVGYGRCRLATDVATQHQVFPEGDVRQMLLDRPTVRTGPGQILRREVGQQPGQRDHPLLARQPR